MFQYFECVSASIFTFDRHMPWNDTETTDIFQNKMLKMFFINGFCICVAKSRVSQLPFIYLYNTNAIIISLIMVNTLLLFHVESLMFDACADKALLKSLCICWKLFLLSSVRIRMTPISQLGKKNRHFGKWVLSQKVLNIFSWD